VEVQPDPELDKLGPEFRHTVVVVIKTTDGRSLSEQVHTAKGSNKRPMTVDEVLNKYRALANKALSHQQVIDLQRMVQNLDELPNVTRLSECLCSG
jgi:2-methylcitrate dehydratase PrpD